jgi:hypothetical protein
MCDTEELGDNILAVMCHKFLKNIHSDILVGTIRTGDPHRGK